MMNPDANDNEPDQLFGDSGTDQASSDPTDILTGIEKTL